LTQAPAPIAFFLPNLKGGGAERVILDLAHYFADQGHAVELLLLAKRGEYLAEVQPNVRVEVLAGGVLPLQLLSFVRYLRRRKPQVMLSTMIGCNITAAVARRLAAPEMRLVLREMDTLSRRLKLRHPLVGLMYGALVKWVYHWADCIIAVSQGVAEDLTRQLPRAAGMIEVIYNPSVTPRVEALAQQTIAHPWFTDCKGPVLVSAGRLEPQKDFATLIRALAIFRQAVPARLMLLGKGSQLCALQALAAELEIADAVSFEGFQPNPMAYMVQADAYVLSSRNEGMPNALIQAMACGCPVVATDCPSGPREVLADAAYGPLVPVGDAKALAKAIAQLLEVPLSPEKLKARAQAFHIDVIAPQYAQLLGLEAAI